MKQQGQALRQEQGRSEGTGRAFQKLRRTGFRGSSASGSIHSQPTGLASWTAAAAAVAATHLLPVALAHARPNPTAPNQECAVQLLREFKPIHKLLQAVQAGEQSTGYAAASQLS